MLPCRRQPSGRTANEATEPPGWERDRVPQATANWRQPYPTSACQEEHRRRSFGLFHSSDVCHRVESSSPEVGDDQRIVRELDPKYQGLDYRGYTEDGSARQPDREPVPSSSTCTHGLAG